MTTQLTPNARTVGNGRVGTLYATKAQLIEALGAPHFGPGYDEKTTAEWVLTTPDGVATIYDYWWNPQDVWSIGGQSVGVVPHVHAYLKGRGLDVEAHVGMSRA